MGLLVEKAPLPALRYVIKKVGPTSTKSAKPSPFTSAAKNLYGVGRSMFAPCGKLEVTGFGENVPLPTLRYVMKKVGPISTKSANPSPLTSTAKKVYGVG